MALYGEISQNKNLKKEEMTLNDNRSSMTFQENAKASREDESNGGTHITFFLYLAPWKSGENMSWYRNTLNEQPCFCKCIKHVVKDIQLRNKIENWKHDHKKRVR